MFFDTFLIGIFVFSFFMVLVRSYWANKLARVLTVRTLLKYFDIR